MPLRVILVDDHKIVREGIRAILAREPQYQILAEAETGAEAVSLCRKLKPDLVLMDISLPGINGLEATAEVVRHCPGIKVVILSMYADKESVLTATRCGARAYVLKSASSNELLEALRTVASGDSYFSSQVASWLFEAVRQAVEQEGKPTPVAALTSRETQVLRLIASGKSNKEIATLLNLQISTIRTYRKHMMHKLGVTNVAGLTRIAIAAGLAAKIEPDGIRE